MKEKACDLIYLNTKRYISLATLKTFYWSIIFLPIIMVAKSVATIKANGISWETLFPVISFAVWSFMYWAFVRKVQSTNTKNFELRFLVNGIFGLLMSSFFWIVYTTFNFLVKPLFGFDFCLWLLLFYVLFSTIYISLIILSTHKGAFSKIRKLGNSAKVMALDAFLASLIPLAGTLGMITSRWLSTNASVSTHDIVTTISGVSLIFIPSLAHINFVQYFYCKKYKISCDENGDTTSPKLKP